MYFLINPRMHVQLRPLSGIYLYQIGQMMGDELRWECSDVGCNLCQVCHHSEPHELIIDSNANMQGK